MDLINKISSRIIELELQIKLLDYLKRTEEIESDMYDYLVNKLLIKINQEKKS